MPICKMNNVTLRKITLRTACVALGFFGGGGAFGQQALTACASHTPPFVMFDRGAAVSGFSYELLQWVAKQVGRELRVIEVPWTRCLNEVKAGRIDLVIDAYEDAERRKTYVYSSPYHTLTPQIFFRLALRNEMTRITQVRDLARYKGCGVRDFTYEHYDLDAAKLDLGAVNDQNMLSKLKAGYCDYAVEELEYIIGGRASIAQWPDESDLDSFRPIWAKGPKVHFLSGKNSRGAKALMVQVDQAIASAERSGLSGALRKKYLETSPQAPGTPRAN